MANKTKPRRGFGKLVIALTMVLLLGYGFIIEPRSVVVTQIQKQVGLKGATFTIAQLSDLHLSGMGATEEATLSYLKTMQPDLILLSGDVIDDRHALPELDAFLKFMLPDQKFNYPYNKYYVYRIIIDEAFNSYSSSDSM